MSAAEASAQDAPLSRGSVSSETVFAAWERQPSACIGGLLVGWTTVVYALIWTTIVAAASAFGIIIDALFGSGNSVGHFLIDDVQTGIGSVALAILGGLRAPGYLFAGAVIAQLIVIVLIAAEPLLLSLQGYRRLSRREAALIAPLLDSVCEAMSIERRPAIWVAEKHTFGAWTHLRTIVLHQAIGLHADNRVLDDEQLQALLAHELHHWQSGDSIADRLAWACSLPVYIPYLFARRIQDASPLFSIIAWFFLWPSWALITLVIGPLAAAGVRGHEWDADAAAARAGYRIGLRRLLEDQTAFEPPRSNWEKVLYATHPPLELRLERLEDEPEPLPAAGDAGAQHPPPARTALRAPQLPASAVLGRLLPAAALALAAVLVFRADPFGSASTSHANSPPVPGAQATRGGVPVGYGPDARGAVAAAANYNESFLSTSADPARFAPAISAMAAPGARDRLTQQVQSIYDAALANASAANPGLSGLRLGITAQTLADRPGAITSRRATVEVASSVTVTIDAPGSRRGSVTRNRCGLYAYGLIRIAADWKLETLTAEPPATGGCVPAGFTAVPR